MSRKITTQYIVLKKFNLHINNKQKKCQSRAGGKLFRPVPQNKTPGIRRSNNIHRKFNAKALESLT
jgi:hypothetical protein